MIAGCAAERQPLPDALAQRGEQSLTGGGEPPPITTRSGSSSTMASATAIASALMA